MSRYDRRTHGRQLERVHQEDLCQALGVHPNRKYEQAKPGGRRCDSRVE
ncbi:MAG: HipA domain-containing protein [Promicromonosporaceae bacterium]|nr:HipA domain-containing protein [Promicromonosporaceae bacterium]